MEHGITRHRLVGPRYQPVVRGVHARATAEIDLRLQCDAALLVVPAESVFSHWTATALLGGPVMRKLPWLQVISPDSRTRRPEVRGTRHSLSASDSTWLGHYPVTTPERTFVDLATTTPLPELVAVGDWMLNSRLVTRSSIHASVVHAAGHRGVVRARAAAILLDGGAQSPPESMLRIKILDAGLPAPEVNTPIFDELGEYISCPDLRYRKAKVAIEYEGAHHREVEQFRRDTARDQLLAGLGWVTLRATSRDLRPTSSTLTDSIRTLLAAREYLDRPSGH